MTVESNMLTTTSLIDDDIASQFVTSVRNSVVVMADKIYDTLDTTTLNYDLIILATWDNTHSARQIRRLKLEAKNTENTKNTKNNKSNSNEFPSRRIKANSNAMTRAPKANKRNLLQYSSGSDRLMNVHMNSVFDYDICIEWEIKIADVLTKVIVEDIIIDYSRNMSDFIVLDYFGAGEAYITIEIVSTELTTTESISPDPTVLVSIATDELKGDMDSQIVQEINDTTRVVGILITVIICILCIASWGYVKFYKGNKSDPINKVALIKYILNMTDFMSDICFTYVLLLQNYSKLFLVSVSILVITFLMSMINAVYWLRRWRNWTEDNPDRLREYVKKHEMIVGALSLLANFYSAIDCVRSKFMYQEIFYIPLKENEYNQNKAFNLLRFCNIIVLENIPELIIQIIYISDVNNHQINTIAFIALISSIMSVALALWRWYLNISNLFYQHLDKFSHLSTIKMKCTFKSNKFENQHVFAYVKISQALKSVLRNASYIKQGNVRQEIEVYYLYFDKAQKTLDVYFDVRLLHPQSKIISKQFKENIYDLVEFNQHLQPVENYQSLIVSVSSLLKLGDDLSIIHYDEPRHHKKSLHDNGNSVEFENMVSREGIRSASLSQGGNINVDVADDLVVGTARHRMSISGSDNAMMNTPQVVLVTQVKEGERYQD